MRYPYNTTSLVRLDTVHPDLVRLFIEVANHIDTSILCGRRDEAEQEEAFASGKSKAKFPWSMHNISFPDRPVAIAVDAGPYIASLKNVPWTDGINSDMTFDEMQVEVKRLTYWYEFAGVVKTVARNLDISVRWGGDFKSIFDPPHWELYGEKYNNT